MERLLAVEILKLYLGTLFVSCYELVTLDSLKKILRETCGKMRRLCHYTCHTPLCMLRNLILTLETREADLLRFSSNNFLGNFMERAPFLFKNDLPSDNADVSATYTFFMRYFDNDFALINQDDHFEMVEWCLYVVQFEEGNVERTKATMELLRDVKTYVENLVCFKDVDDVDIDVDDNDEDDGDDGDIHSNNEIMKVY